MAAVGLLEEDEHMQWGAEQVVVGVDGDEFPGDEGIFAAPGSWLSDAWLGADDDDDVDDDLDDDIDDDLDDDIDEECPDDDDDDLDDDFDDDDLDLPDDED